MWHLKAGARHHYVMLHVAIPFLATFLKYLDTLDTTEKNSVSVSKPAVMGWPQTLRFGKKKL